MVRNYYFPHDYEQLILWPVTLIFHMYNNYGFKNVLFYIELSDFLAYVLLIALWSLITLGDTSASLNVINCTSIN